MVNKFSASLRLAAAILLAGAVVPAAAQIKVSGSDTLETYTRDSLMHFERAGSGKVEVVASFKGTSAGLRDLCDGRAGIAPASSRMDRDTATRCEASKVSYLELPIAVDAIAVVMHPSRRALGELTMAELNVIFNPDSAAKVTRWAQVRAGLPDAPLHVVSLDPRSGTTALFGSVVYGLRGYVRNDAKTTSDHAEVIKLVAADPNAIGFVSLGALSDARAAVWSVPVNFGRGPVAPSQETVLNQTYASLSRVMYLYANRAALTEKGGQTLPYLTWLNERGARMATSQGFLPLQDRFYQDNLRRLQER